MQYVALVCAALLVIAVIYAAVQGSRVSIKSKEIEDLKKQIADMVAARMASKLAEDEKSARSERIIAELKAEVTNLENDLAANRDPAAVRARLSKLLSDP